MERNGGSSAGYSGWGSDYQSVGDLLKIPNSNNGRKSVTIYQISPEDNNLGTLRSKRSSIDSELSDNSWNRRLSFKLAGNKSRTSMAVLFASYP